MTSDLPDIGSDDALELFIAQYQVLFGPHPSSKKWNVGCEGIAAKERDMWRRVVDRIQPKHFEQVLELVRIEADSTQRRGKPLLPHVEAAARKISGRFTGMSSAPSAQCSLCSSTGMILVPCSRPTPERKTWCFDPEIAPLTEFSWPCRCSLGRDMQAHSMRDIDPKLVDRARSMYDLMLRQCEPVSDERLSHAEFLERYKSPLTTPKGIANQMIADSIKMRVAPAAVAPAVVEEQKKIIPVVPKIFLDAAVDPDVEYERLEREAIQDPESN
jgi:hypothetical protein